MTGTRMLGFREGLHGLDLVLFFCFSTYKWTVSLVWQQTFWYIQSVGFSCLCCCWSGNQPERGLKVYDTPKSWFKETVKVYGWFFVLFFIFEHSFTVLPLPVSSAIDPCYIFGIFYTYTHTCQPVSIRQAFTSCVLHLRDHKTSSSKARFCAVSTCFPSSCYPVYLSIPSSCVCSVM